MQYSILIDAGCTVDAVPYKVLDLEASKLNFVGPEMKFTPVMAVLLVLENAPVGVVPFVFPTGWNVPVMFGRPNITGEVWSIPGTYVGSSGGINGGESGAMYRTKHGKSDVTNDQTGSPNSCDGVAIDASKSSSIYSTTSTVQPSSVRALLCIKA